MHATPSIEPSQRQHEHGEGEKLRYVIAVLAFAGIVVSSLALAGRYDPPVRPIEIVHSHWNSSYVNQSPYSNVHGVPVAVLGIVCYALLLVLALLRHRVLTVYLACIGVAYAFHLTHIQAQVLRVWCVYHVSSLILIVLIAFLAFGELLSEPPQVTQR
jgi:uncharacterized membrane protein